MEICILASGSSGNCLYVAGGGTRLLVDVGLSLKNMTARLAQIGVGVESIHGVLFTHEHTDHCNGVAVLQRKHKLPLYANEGTAAGVQLAIKDLAADWNIFENGATFTVGTLTVEAFSVPHDAADAVGFVISDGRVRVGIATDLGTTTTLVRRKLADCDALVLEANHDVAMLKQSGRPWSLIQRIFGQHGHLSNEDAAELIATVASPRLKVVFLAHLSDECNSPTLAERVIREALRRASRDDIRIECTRADVISSRVEL